MEEEAILAVVRGNPLCRGVTFSGGEPFAQAAGFAALGRSLKERGYEDVRLIDTTDGLFMGKKEGAWLGLGGSALLVGRK